MNDMRPTIVPKSDQLNADDLLAGPKDITITKVLISAEADQPVSLHYEGDQGKPYKICKSMRRCIVVCWGPDANVYVGRSMRLYRDPNVRFGGVAVGGIRISHLSHIERDVTMALTETRASRKPFTVKPLAGAVSPPPAGPREEGNSPPAPSSRESGFDVLHFVDMLEPLLTSAPDDEALRTTWANAQTDLLTCRRINPQAYQGLVDAKERRKGELANV